VSDSDKGRRRAAYEATRPQYIQDCAHNAAIQTTLRAILLKLNSLEANNLMCTQVKEQIKEMYPVWARGEAKHLDKCVSFFGEELRDELRGRLSREFSDIQFQAGKILDGIFSPPEDVAGIL